MTTKKEDTDMTYHFNAKGAERKALAQKISEITGDQAVYLKVPTCAYQIGIYNLSKDGALNCPDTEEAYGLIRELISGGYRPEEADLFEEPATAEDPGTTPEKSAEMRHTGLTIELPLEGAAVGNLMLLLEAKGNLIKEALGITELPVEIRENTVAFPWFETLPTPDELKAYTALIAAIYQMAKEAKRVTAKEKAVDNHKYAFRCFLLRLGFIGDEYKQTRKILLKSLSGSSAFRDGKKGGEQA